MPSSILTKGWFKNCSITYPSGRRLWLPPFPNGLTTAGINHMNDVTFRGASQNASWYLGLIANSGFTTVAAADTSSSHSGWTEDQNYSEATRVAWAPEASASGLLVNAAAREFTINAAATIKGIFISSSNTKGGTAGTLFSTGLFPSVNTLPIGAVLKIYYELETREG